MKQHLFSRPELLWYSFNVFVLGFLAGYFLR
jgi:hypothetical protein